MRDTFEVYMTDLATPMTPDRATTISQGFDGVIVLARPVDAGFDGWE